MNQARRLGWGLSEKLVNGHLVVIRKDGVPAGVQLRTGRGAGQSTYFAAKKHGSFEAAVRAARRDAEAKGIGIGLHSRGGLIGRRVALTKVEPGITFRWREYGGVPRLVVAVTWPEKGKGRHTCYSVEANGLEGALDLAIERRVKAGAPRPDRNRLLLALRKEYVTNDWAF